MKRIRIPENLTTLAYKSIKNYILDGRLDHGARLTEEFLAQQLGISKSPIREALNRLETEGLIRIEPRRGAYLRTFSTEEIREIYDVREALEMHAVSRIQVTPALIQDLRASVDRARKYLAANERSRYIEEDISFHERVAEASGNMRLAKVLENLQCQVWLFRRKTFAPSTTTAVENHSAIVESLARGDKERAERFMGEHISEVREKLIQYLSENSSEAPEPDAAYT